MKISSRNFLYDRYNDIVSIINLATDLLTSRPRSIILHASSCRGPEILWKNLLSNVAKSSQFFLLRSQFSDEYMRTVDPIVRRFEWSSFYKLKYARYSDNVYTHFGRRRRDLRRWSIVASPSPLPIRKKIRRMHGGIPLFNKMLCKVNIIHLFSSLCNWYNYWHPCWLVIPPSFFWASEETKIRCQAEFYRSLALRPGFELIQSVEPLYDIWFLVVFHLFHTSLPWD